MPFRQEKARPDVRHTVYQNRRARDIGPQSDPDGPCTLFRRSWRRVGGADHAHNEHRCRRSGSRARSCSGSRNAGSCPRSSKRHRAARERRRFFGPVGDHDAESRVRCQPPIWRPMRSAHSSANSSCDSPSSPMAPASRSCMRSMSRHSSASASRSSRCRPLRASTTAARAVAGCCRTGRGPARWIPGPTAGAATRRGKRHR